jgi:hypothetical protein
MKTENKEIIDHISDISIKYGKEAALGYTIGILEMNKLDVVLSVKELIPEVKPAPKLKPLYPTQKVPEPSTIVDLNVGNVRKITEPKKTYERKADEVKANKDRIIQCLTINKCGLPVGEIVDYVKDINYNKVQCYLRLLMEAGIVSDQEKCIVHGRSVAKYTLTNGLNGNITLTDNRKD